MEQIVEFFFNKRVEHPFGIFLSTATLRTITVDFFGLVVLPLHTIYIVPKLSMDGRTKAYVYPENPDSARLLERYRENWGLL